MVLPAENTTRLCGVAKQIVDLGQAEVTGVDPDQNLSRGSIDPRFVLTSAVPDDIPIDLGKRHFDKLPHAVGLTGGQDIIVRMILLKHEPHAFHVVSGVAPVADGVEIAQEQAILQPVLDRCHGSGYLAGNEMSRREPGFHD